MILKRLGFAACVIQLLILSGCTGINTTYPGVVGINRTQYMFDPITAKEMKLSYAQSYSAALSKAKQQGIDATDTPQGKRVQAIALRIVKQARYFRPDAQVWDWNIALIRNPELNANCGPGGKIIVFTGLIDTLKATDDELASVISHEVSHALREHSREQASSKAAFEIAGTLGASALGAGSLGKTAISKLLDAGVGLPFSRRDETEADLMGLELAARAGFDPRASVTLWKKMEALSKASMLPGFLRTHPTNQDRIVAIQQMLPKVMPLYQAALLSKR